MGAPGGYWGVTTAPFPPKPDSSPSPALIIAIVLAVVAGPFAADLLIAGLDGDYCEQSCPGDTPLGSALAFGPPHGLCETVAGSPSCWYVFPVAGSGDAPPPSNVTVQLVNANGTPASTPPASIGIDGPSGCVVALWNASSQRWGSPSPLIVCNGTSPESAIPDGSSIVLLPSPSDRLSLTGEGLDLELVGTGPYSGSIEQPIP